MATSSTTIGLRALAELNARDLLPIVRDVCRVHGVTLEEVCGTLRSRSVNRARHEVWWRVRNHPGRHYSASDLGRIFARNPETIRVGVHAHARRLAADSVPERSRD
jgi:chromosomal replication initiation ATPase DnaA